MLYYDLLVTFRFRKIIPFGGKQMNRILAVAILLVMAGCSVTQPYVTNISPAGEQGILVESCVTKCQEVPIRLTQN